MTLMLSLLVGYTIIALNQEVRSKIDPKSHVNTLDPLLIQLRKRKDVIFLKRLTLLLDEESEKGNGMVCLGFSVPGTSVINMRKESGKCCAFRAV